LALPLSPQAGPRGFFDLLADPARYASLGPHPKRDYPLFGSPWDFEDDASRRS